MLYFNVTKSEVKIDEEEAARKLKENRVLEDIFSAIVIVIFCLCIACWLKNYLNKKYYRDYAADYVKGEQLFEKCLQN
jgi:hypothetical protein